jgi:hypothetical protein
MNIKSAKFTQICEEFKSAISNWKDPNDDEVMEKVYRSDREDLKEVLELLQKGDFEKAWAKAQRLDTIVRDLIPDLAWNLMESLG